MLEKERLGHGLVSNGNGFLVATARAKLIVSDDCMHKLEPKMRECAEFLKKALLDGFCVRLRFHDDCDGISAGIALNEALLSFQAKSMLAKKHEGFPAISSAQSQSAIYEKKSAFEDLEFFKGASKKPVLVLLDFGANSESMDAVRALKSSGAKVAVIDHHPPAVDAEILADAFVSSHFCDDCGAHCAGLLSNQIALFIDNEVSDEYAWYALQGDKSPLAKKQIFKEAIALDYLAHHSEKGVSADFYAEKLSDLQSVDLAYTLAVRSEKKTLELSVKHTKVQGCECPLTFLVINLEKLAKKGEYPSKGKIINAVHILQSEKTQGPLVSFGYTSDGVSVRANKAAIDAGFKASSIIIQLKLEFSNEITSGGGHDSAASIKLSCNCIDRILSRFEKLACQQFKSPPPATSLSLEKQKCACTPNATKTGSKCCC